MRINEKIKNELKYDDVEEIRDYITKYSWCGNNGYATTNVRQDDGRWTKLLMHKLLISELFEPYPEGLHIDHVDGNPLNNTLINLRVVTRQENQWNRVRAKGYYWNKRDKRWHAKIRLNGRQRYLGYYASEAEARAAYIAAKDQLHIITPYKLILKEKYRHLEYLRNQSTNIAV